MSQKEKKSKWSNNAIWEQFIKPLVAWIASLKLDEETNDVIDMVENAEYQMKRGNRNADARPNIVKSLKLEFSDMNFEGWANVRIDKAILEKIKKMVAKNRNSHIEFFNNSIIKPTFTVGGKRYTHTVESYAQKAGEADERLLKAQFKELGSLEASFEVKVDEPSS